MKLVDFASMDPKDRRTLVGAYKWFISWLVLGEDGLSKIVPDCEGKDTDMAPLIERWRSLHHELVDLEEILNQYGADCGFGDDVVQKMKDIILKSPDQLVVIDPKFLSVPRGKVRRYDFGNPSKN